MNKKKLNVNWVSDTIGDEYKKWKIGDVVNINAMTGTGKTHFIVNALLVHKVEEWEKLIYICNRIELKRQIKLELLKVNRMKAKYFDKDGKEFFDSEWIIKNDIMISFKWLDAEEEIKNVTIKSYHQIAEMRKNRLFEGSNYFYLDQFQYIVCDECQFYLTDASFNQKTFFAFDELVTMRNQKSITINLSATMDEVEKLIDEQVNYWMESSMVFGSYSELNYWRYDTNIDYSYLNVKYFKEIDAIIKEIFNSQDKWLIFVTGMDMGNKLKREIDDLGISCEFISAGSESIEKGNITTKSKFNCKVLIATKCIDNGVNIKDLEVKNIVVMAWDKITFIQELGRLRLDIKCAHEVNLYIKCASKKSFQNLINGNTKGAIGYKEKFETIELFNDDIKEFEKKYNNDFKAVAQDIFYLDRKDNSWSINELGVKRLELDNAFAERMIEEFKLDEFAFIKEQLRWLKLEDTFSENNLLDEEFDYKNMKELEMFLIDSYENEVLYTKEYFIETIGEIILKDENLRLLLNKQGGHGNRGKGQKMFNKLFEELQECGLIESKYIVSSRPKKETIDKKRVKKTYWIITKEEQD